MEIYLLIFVLIAVIALGVFLILINKRIVQIQQKSDKHEQQMENLKTEIPEKVIKQKSEIEVPKNDKSENLLIDDNEINLKELEKADSIKIEYGNSILCELEQAKGNYTISTQKFQTNDSLKRNLEVIINQTVPNVALLANIMKTQGKFIAKFPPEIMKGLKNGTIKLMRSGTEIKAIAVNSSTKKITKIATLEATQSALNPLSTAIAVWQVLAFITAQKYLSDMNSKMQNIIEQINDLKYKLDNERIGKIEGNLKYLQSFYELLNNGFVKSDDLFVYNIQLETIERECLQVIHAFNLDISSYINQKFKTIDKDLGLEQNTKIITDALNEYDYMLKGIYFSYYGLLVQSQIKSNIAFNKDYLIYSLADIEQKLKEQNEQIKTFYTNLSDMINKLKGGMFTSKKTEIEIQDGIKNRYKELQSSWKDFEKELQLNISQQKEKVKALDIASEKELLLELSVNNKGDIIEMKKIEN